METKTKFDELFEELQNEINNGNPNDRGGETFYSTYENPRHIGEDSLKLLRDAKST